MVWSMLLGMLLSLIGASPAHAEPGDLAGDLPEGFALDGAVSEWTGPPALALSPAAQVAGDSPVADADDFSLRLWWALTDEGLTVAAEVRDDVLLAPGSPGDVPTSDHIAVWLAMPPAEPPPPGFEDQRGLRQIASPSDCDALAGEGNADACRSWLAEQRRRRLLIGGLFARRYALSALGVHETWSGSCAPKIPSFAPFFGVAGCSNAVAQVLPTEGGWTLEARIPLQDLPATGALNVDRVQILVEAVDNDVDHSAQESLLSSAPEVAYGDVRSFPAVRLARPLRFDSDPPLLGAVLAAEAEPALFAFPAQPLAEAWMFENLAWPDQAAPNRPSPEITWIPLSPLTPVATLDDLTVYSLPLDGAWCGGCAAGRRLVVLRQGEVLASRPIGTAAVVATFPRPPQLHLALLETTPPRAIDGRAAPLHGLSVLALDPSGSLTELLNEEVDESVLQPGEETEDGAEPVGWRVTGVSLDRNLSGEQLRLVGQRMPDGASEGRPWQLRVFWDSASSTWEVEDPDDSP